MRSGILNGKWVWILRTVLSLFSVVAEDLTPEIANGQLPRAQHSRAHTSSSLSGHCTLLLDNFLANFLEVAELSLDYKSQQAISEAWRTSVWQFLCYWPFGLQIHAGDTLNQNCNKIYREWCCKIRFTPTKVSSDFEYVIRLYFSRFCPMGLAHLGSGFWKSFYSSGFKVGILNAPELNI